MALRRLAGKTENSAPVLTLITQFGGGKTHNDRVWFNQPLPSDEVAFEADVYLLTKAKATALKTIPVAIEPGDEPGMPEKLPLDLEQASVTPLPHAQQRIVRIFGTIPPEVWNRLGTKLLPKLR